MSTQKKMPKGGRRGGTTFPRVDLEQAVGYARKLVSKTHTAAQPADIVLAGVFGAKSEIGEVRAAALRQFGLLDGNPRGYFATELAKKIMAATKDDLPNLLHESLLKPGLFKKLFDTFCNDNVSRSRVRQQALSLKVHPESVDECTDLFVTSAVFAGLAQENGDSVSFHPAGARLPVTGPDARPEQYAELPDADTGKESTETVTPGELGGTEASQGVARADKVVKGRGRADISIQIDPSMDPEKLDKLLNVLRKYDQI